MNTIDKNNPEPLYIQLEELIRNNIDNGIWRPQTAILSGKSELSMSTDLSRMTIRTVARIWFRKVWVPGKGTLYRT